MRRYRLDFGPKHRLNQVCLGIEGQQTNNRAHMAAYVHALQVICTHALNYYSILPSNCLVCVQLCHGIANRVYVWTTSKLLVRTTTFFCLFVQAESHTVTQVDGVSQLGAYRRNGWRKLNGKSLANVDLWMQIASLSAISRHVTLHHVNVDSVLLGKRLIDRENLRVQLRATLKSGQCVAVFFADFRLFFFQTLNFFTGVEFRIGALVCWRVCIYPKGNLGFFFLEKYIGGTC